MHPPAGATALLAVTQSQTIALGWFLFPVVLLGVALMQAAAVVINNVQRQYPLYWWTSYPLSPRGDVEKASRKERLETPSEDSLTGIPRRLVVEQSEVSVPDGILLSAEEEDVLERIRRRL